MTSMIRRTMNTKAFVLGAVLVAAMLVGPWARDARALCCSCSDFMGAGPFCTESLSECPNLPFACGGTLSSFVFGTCQGNICIDAATPTPTNEPTPAETDVATPTVTPTPTLSPTPSSTATVTPGPLDHFLCYEIHRPSINVAGVTTLDQFFPDPGGMVTVRQAKRLCAPVNKNGEDPTAPSHPGHETFYTIRQTAPKFQLIKDVPVLVANTFGSQPPTMPLLTVDLVRAERMLVPTSKSLVGPGFPPPLAVDLDHFKCYRVRGARFRRTSVAVETQFGPLSVAIKRPRDLCVPVDKNGEGIFNEVPGLMCFQVRTAPQTPKQVFTQNQFEQGAYDIFGVRDLCVPAFVNPGTCGDGTINAPGEDCESGTGNDAACPGLCDTEACKCSAPQLTATPTPTPTPTETATPTAIATPEPCGTPNNGACGGACPPGKVCSDTANGCVCVPGTVPCTGLGDPSYPTCGGACPQDLTCYPASLTIVTTQTGCACAPTGVACGPAVGLCPDGLECPSGQVCKIQEIDSPNNFCSCAAP